MEEHAMTAYKMAANPGPQLYTQILNRAKALDVPIPTNFPALMAAHAAFQAEAAGRDAATAFQDALCSSEIALGEVADPQWAAYFYEHTTPKTRADVQQEAQEWLRKIGWPVSATETPPLTLDGDPDVLTP
jgi:hypothetical protein